MRSMQFKTDSASVDEQEEQDRDLEPEKAAARARAKVKAAEEEIEQPQRDGLAMLDPAAASTVAKQGISPSDVRRHVVKRSNDHASIAARWAI